MATIHFIPSAAPELTGLFLALSNVEQAAKCAASVCLSLGTGEPSALGFTSNDLANLVQSIQRQADKLRSLSVGGMQ